MDSNKKKYLDKIVEHLVNGTKYDTDQLDVYIIKFPFSDIWEVFGSHGEMSNIYDISSSRFVEEHRWNFDQEMIEVFDLMEHEADYVWEKYFVGARFFGREYAKSDGLINESIDKQKQFLYKVADQLARETDIDLVNDRIRYPYGGLNTTCGGVVVDTPFIVSHLINVYGLTNKEIDEVVSMYTQFIKRKLKFDLRGGRINDNG